MATIEHCLYCFESLAAHLEDRKPMSLAELQKSYAEYLVSADEPRAPAAAKHIPALRRVADTSTASSASSASLSSSSSSSTTLSPDSDIDTPMTSATSLSTDAAPTETPLFVTWNTVQDRHGTDGGGSQLRGCIGTFEPQPLEAGLASYALTSALHDVRFDPVAAPELPRLEAAVTLLTDFEDCAGPADWELGTHGIRIAFGWHGRRYGATYLPDVAPEQGWSKEETLVSLMRKAGWVGRKERWSEVELKVVRYRGRKASAVYADFKKWRDWVVRKAEAGP